MSINRQSAGKLRYRPTKAGINPYRALLWIGLILGCVWVILQLQRGNIQSPLLPTPTPTRSAESYILQAQAYFQAGKLDDPASSNDAIDTYLKAMQVDPQNATVLAELARIQTYSSSLVSTDQERLVRLQQARDNVRRAAEIAPDDSTILALQAFVIDWNASSNLISSTERDAYLAEAESAANRAYLLDPDNALALAFYAEVLLDQQKWDQALEYAEQAVTRSPDLMDTHRVYATVLESVGAYRDAIQEYQLASDITPNLTFLLLRIGLIYRNLGNREVNKGAAQILYNSALSFFDQAAQINQQLGIQDPQPYIAIAKTYTQQGEFFVASRNAEKALSFEPTSADTYGQLGMIYVQARNYESALSALRCAVDGCSADENQIAQELILEGLIPVEQDLGLLDDEELDALVKTLAPAIQPLALTNSTVAYYYIRYGSVLAYLSDAQNGYCERSMDLMQTLRKLFSDDEVLLENVEVNEATCQMLLETYSAP